MRSWSRLLLGLTALGLVLGAAASPAPASIVHPDDPAFARGTQWNLTAIGAPTAWQWGTGQGVTIAIVDTGIDLHHVDLAGHVVGGTDCIGAAGNPADCHGSGQDDDGHGSHVAGIAAAVTDNGRGVAGVAPGASLLAVRVLADSCADTVPCEATGSAADVVAGVRWATEHGAQVVNLSIGADDAAFQSADLARAVEDAWHAGVIVVAAAGNRVVTRGLGALPVIVVTAVDRGLRLASYAAGTGGARWGLAAPGGEAGDDPASCRPGGRPAGILSTYWNPAAGANQYACLSGTSMAAPQVAGAAAILRSIGYTPAQTVARLLATARDLGAPGPDRTFGAGLLAVDRAARPGPIAITRRAGPSVATLGLATAAGDSKAVAGDVVPRPTPPPLLPTMLAGSILALSATAAAMVAWRIWQERTPAG